MELKDRVKQLAKPFLGDAPNLRAEADQLRDARNYAEAAEVYGRYLALEPGDFGIWVQRGNCLKDAGALSEATLAYEAALRLNPQDADVHLQMGHLLKLRGMRAEAIKFYKKSHNLDPTDTLALAELEHLGVRTTTRRSPLEAAELKDVSAKIFDISDLLIYLAEHHRVTGIQRVQAAIIYELLQGFDAETDAVKGVVFAYCNFDEQSVYAVSSAAVRDLIAHVQSKDATHQDVTQQLVRIYASKTKLNPRKNDVYIILGAFWVGHDYTECLLHLKNNGVCIGVYIYDLIPLTHPQFVTESTRQAVVDKVGDVMALADFVLTISEYVAGEVTSVLRDELNRTIPVHAVPLSHQLTVVNDEDDDDVDEFKSGLPKQYVLCVCTLEGRKNHLLLLHAWSALNRKYNGAIPALILVGKWGWRIEEFQTQIEAERYVDGKIIILGNLSDAHVKYLYQNCLFTVFPSFVEGWGLPVGESLAYGKPCIASNAASIPEVGGDFCRYINPYDALGATAVIERAIVDRDDLEAWTRRVVNDFKIRTWKDTTKDFLEKVDDALAIKRTTTAQPAVILNAGQLYKIRSNDARGQSWKARATKLVCAAGWLPFENWGVWAGRRTSKIEFGTTLAPGTKVKLFLHLRLPPPTVIDGISISDTRDNSINASFSNSFPKWVQMESETDENGKVGVQLARLGPVQHLQKDRELYVGLSAVGYHAIDSLAERVSLVEGIVLADELTIGATIIVKQASDEDRDEVRDKDSDEDSDGDSGKNSDAGDKKRRD